MSASRAGASTKPGTARAGAFVQAGPPRAGASGGRPPRPPARAGSTRGAHAILPLVAALGLLSGSCAYYNTFYLAKRYYSTATAGMPYTVEKQNASQSGNFQKSIDYSKKLIAGYPKSKWVDDAYLLWAQALIGKDDPLQTITMLQDFSARYPDSPRRDDATFYLGVAQRQARKYHEALVSLDEYLEKAPEGELAPYAYYERSHALMSLDRPREAALAATQVIERYPKHPLVVRVRAARAEALLAGGDPAAAREDFQALGLRAINDEERFSFLLREADCLEAARDYAGGLDLLTAALSHEVAPVKSAAGAAPTGPGADRYGRLTLRIGTIHMLAGRPEEALTAYHHVIQDYPKTLLAAEAQYRVGYVYETVLDDFETARQEYAKVRDQSVSSAFFAQAAGRLLSLERLARFRSAGSDSSDREVEAGFLLAEQYLFQLDKPERALEAYAEIAREHEGTPVAGKALNAQAWVLRRKLDRPAAADSLLWKVVREYPATESQLAARDYLEAGGTTVPADLIKLPGPEGPAPDTTLYLTPAPMGPTPLGAPQAPGWQLRAGAADSVVVGKGEPQVGPPYPGRPGIATGPGFPSPSDSTGKVSPGRIPPGRTGPGLKDSLSARTDTPRPTPADTTRFPAGSKGLGGRVDSLRRAAADTTLRGPAKLTGLAPADSTRRPSAGTVRPAADTTWQAVADTARRAAADTTRRAPADTTRRAPADTTQRRWIPTDTTRWAPR